MTRTSAVILGALLIVMGISSGVWAASPAKARFVDNGNGTITDTQTGLMWEKKSTVFGLEWVGQTYTWSSTGTSADGTLFTDFLATMNCTFSADGTCGPGGYRDWRIPTVEELRTILSADCPAGVCIDPIFGAADGYYWTSTSGVGGSAWIVGFYTRVVGTQYNTDFQHARAVRGGR